MCLLRGTDLVFIYNSDYVWIWEQTAIISLYCTNWLVLITETECLLRGTDWISNYGMFHIKSAQLQGEMKKAGRF